MAVSVTISGSAERTRSYLQGPIIHQNSIELLQGLGGTIGTAKDDGGNPAARSVRAVCELYTLDWSNCGMEIFLDASRESVLVRLVFQWQTVGVQARRAREKDG